MTPEPNPNADKKLTEAIGDLVRAVRSEGSGEAETAAILALVSQIRAANQNLVLATLKAQVLQEEAERRAREQNEFLAMLAHELRNPLAPISHSAVLLEKLSTAHPMIPTIQGIISRQVGQMARLIDDLLDASRINSGRIQLRTQPIALRDIIDRSVEVVRPAIDKAHQQLDIDVPDAPVILDGDPVRLSQALTNLLVNASKYTQQGGRIEISATAGPGIVDIVVRDNGIGMDADLLPHVFDLFRQGARTLERSEGGLGIGLSVTKRLVEMHGGSLIARSDGANRGSELTLSLPANRPPSTKPEPAQPSSERTSPDRRPLDILIVEDNADANATLRMVLEMAGHRVSFAHDGLTGVKLAGEQKFDVMLCDIGLPGLDGYGMIGQLRQRRGAEQRPVAIALSGYGQPEDINRAMEAGFDHYLVKPVQGETLLNVLHSLAG